MKEDLSAYGVWVKGELRDPTAGEFMEAKMRYSEGDCTCGVFQKVNLLHYNRAKSTIQATCVFCGKMVEFLLPTEHPWSNWD